MDHIDLSSYYQPNAYPSFPFFPSTSSFLFPSLTRKSFIWMFALCSWTMNPGIPPWCLPSFFVLHNASWGCQYNMQPNWWMGMAFFFPCHFPRDLSCALNLGWITPHLFSIAARFTAISPTLWASMISDPPAWLDLIITVSDVTLVRGPISLTFAFLLGIAHALESMTASARTFMCTIIAAQKGEAKSLFTILSHLSFFPPSWC